MQTPQITALLAGATFISLSWDSAGTRVDSYQVAWKQSTGECSDVDEGMAIVNGSSTSFTIPTLQEDSAYTIIIEAANGAGNTVSNPVSGWTLIARRLLRACVMMLSDLPLLFLFSSINATIAYHCC